MKQNPTRGRPRRRAAIALASSAAAVVACLVLVGFHAQLHPINPPGSDRTSEVTTADPIGIRTFKVARDAVTVQPDITYGTTADGTILDLDVCSPAEKPAAGSLRVGIVSIHGGSWARGDKANDDWRNVCTWLASEGFVAFSVNYRLVPTVHFPAAIDDVQLAVEWVRQHAADYGIDPAHLGAFGGSAGGNLASLLATRGTGALDTGSRVAALAELSGPVDITDRGVLDSGNSVFLRRIASDYLGCTDLARCPQAKNASATSFIDSSDPPTFIAQSQNDLIPLGQSREFAAKLAAAGVKNTLVVVPGHDHSIGILDANIRQQIAAFFRTALTPSPSGTLADSGEPAGDEPTGNEVETAPLAGAETFEKAVLG